jgi:hypothetical protein
MQRQRPSHGVLNQLQSGMEAARKVGKNVTSALTLSAPFECTRRRTTLPLVCKEWQDMALKPSFLWHNMTVDLHNQPSPLRAPARQFFKERCAGNTTTKQINCTPRSPYHHTF